MISAIENQGSREYKTGSSPELAKIELLLRELIRGVRRKQKNALPMFSANLRQFISNDSSEGGNQ